MGKVIGSMKSRLEHIFIRLSSTMPSDPVLAILSAMIRTAQTIISNIHRLEQQDAQRVQPREFGY